MDSWSAKKIMCGIKELDSTLGMFHKVKGSQKRGAKLKCQKKLLQESKKLLRRKKWLKFKGMMVIIPLTSATVMKCWEQKSGNS